MNKLILATVLMSLACFKVQAAEYTILNPANFVSLEDTAQNDIVAIVGYPGPYLAKVCGVEIRAIGAEKPLANLHAALEYFGAGVVDGPLDTTLGYLISVDLTPHYDAYVVNVHIRTKSGESLSKVVKDTLGKNAKAILLQTPCK